MEENNYSEKIKISLREDEIISVEPSAQVEAGGAAEESEAGQSQEAQ